MIERRLSDSMVMSNCKAVAVDPSQFENSPAAGGHDAENIERSLISNDAEAML